MNGTKDRNLDQTQTGPRLVVARILAIANLTQTVKAFTLELDQGPYRFLPGQWVDLYLDVGGRIEIGGYSITSSPLQRGTIELTVRRARSHPAALYLHERARIGELVVVSEGQGDFFYHPQMGQSLVLIAGGIGINPLMSMLRTIDQDLAEAHVALFYSIRTADEFLFGKELLAMARKRQGMRMHVTATRPSAGSWSGPAGRIDATVLRRAQLDPAAQYFLCGPRAMVDDLCVALKEMGIDQERIHSESWAG